MADKLKTLKDLKRYAIEMGDGHETEGRDINELKQEAINWIKEWKEEIEKSDASDYFIAGLEDGLDKFMLFFNITEEDLT